MDAEHYPVFALEIAFYSELGLQAQTGRRYRRLGILEPDAKITTGKWLFKADPESLARARLAITGYRHRVGRTIINEAAYV